MLERSSDNGVTFQPWQYFANTDSDCYNQFGMSSLEEITRDDSVICTSDYSGVVPLENGEVGGIVASLLESVNLIKLKIFLLKCIVLVSVHC